MAVKLVSLRGMPDDEVEEIRALLTENEVSYYETPAGNWGMSMPAIWLRDESALARCKALLAQYQQQRYERKRAEYEQQRQQGDVETFWDRIKQHPLRFIVYMAFLALVLYASTIPFLDFGS